MVDRKKALACWLGLALTTFQYGKIASDQHIKKSHQHLLADRPVTGPVTREMRYQFIQEHRGQFRMTVLLRVLGVSASAFYQWQKRPVSQQAQHKELLVAQICELFEQSKGRYGSPRIYRDLQDLGVRCTRSVWLG